MVTSDYVLDETITALFKKGNFEGAMKFINALFIDIKEKRILLEQINADRFERAWLLRSVYRDKPDISFTDLTSFVVMRDLEICRAFTRDHHFETANTRI